MEQILRGIQSGLYKVNEKLPSENSLAEKYGVSRIVIRRAYERLEDMQYVYSFQGKGRYLRPRLKKINLVLNGDESFTEKVSQQGYEVRTENLFCQPIGYNKRIYDMLNIPETARVYKIARLRLIEEWPVAAHISYLSETIFKDISIEGKQITSIFEYYRSKEYKKFICGDSTLSVSIPSSNERKLLQCTTSIPLITVASNCMDKETRQILEVTTIKYRSDCFKYTV